MARTAGTKSSVRISLKELTEKLKDAPNIKVAVSKGWIAATEEALGVDFGVDTEEGEGEGETPASEARPRAVVE